MGTSCCRCYCLFESRNWEISEGNIKEFEYPTISDEDYLDVENKIQETTGFEPYKSMNIKLNQNMHKIEGTYYQYNKGCILYALLNNGYIDEKYIPASMKYYKDHSHREGQTLRGRHRSRTAGAGRHLQAAVRDAGRRDEEHY